MFWFGFIYQLPYQPTSSIQDLHLPVNIDTNAVNLCVFFVTPDGICVPGGAKSYTSFVSDSCDFSIFVNWILIPDFGLIPWRGTIETHPTHFFFLPVYVKKVLSGFLEDFSSRSTLIEDEYQGIRPRGMVFSEGLPEKPDLRSEDIILVPIPIPRFTRSNLFQ